MRSAPKTRHGRRRPSQGRDQPPPGPAEPPVHPRAIAFVLGAFALVFIGLGLVSSSRKSAVWDEPIHLTAGYAALVRHDYRVDPTHPPFTRMWAALPLLVWHRPAIDVTPIDRTPATAWQEHAYDYSHEFMYVANDADQLLAPARFMVVILGVVLGILLFAWTYEWLGFVPAVFALAFYTISPNIAAHASLATTDMGITCFIFGAVYFLWRTKACLSPTNVAGLAVFFALAMVAKFTGVILVPIVALLLVLAAASRSAITPRAGCAIAVLLATSAIFAIWAVYGFRYTPSSSTGWLLQAPGNVPYVSSVVLWIDAHHLLPNAFSVGFLGSIPEARSLSGFLAGRISTTGWWYFLPIAFLIKTPVPLLLLAATGLLVYAARWRRLGGTNEAFVVVPIVVFTAIAMWSRISLGLRHILPIYPFVCLIAAGAVSELLAWRPRVGWIAVGALTTFWLAKFIGVYPDTLTFFNQFVGGPSQGANYLVDSNLDWGQHLKALKAWMRDNGVAHINLAYFGRADPDYYDIDCTYLPGGPSFTLNAVMRPQLPGYVAISVTTLSGVYLTPPWRVYYSAFQDLAPVAEIGHSIRIYWVDRWPEAQEPASVSAAPLESDLQAHAALAQALLQLKWYDHAALHFRRYLRDRPDDAVALDGLGSSVWVGGDHEEGLLAFRRAVSVDTRNAKAHYYLAVALTEERRELDEAFRHAEVAVALSQDDPNAHNLLGQLNAIRGHWNEAEIEFERALALDPGHADARNALVRLNALKVGRRTGR